MNFSISAYFIRIEPTDNKKSSLVYHQQRYDGFAKIYYAGNTKSAQHDSGLYKSNPQMYDRNDKRAVLYHNKLETKRDVI